MDLEVVVDHDGKVTVQDVIKVTPDVEELPPEDTSSDSDNNGKLADVIKEEIRIVLLALNSEIQNQITQIQQAKEDLDSQSQYFKSEI